MNEQIDNPIGESIQGVVPPAGTSDDLPSETDISQTTEEAERFAADLSQRCRRLLEEVEIFESLINSQRRELPTHCGTLDRQRFRVGYDNLDAKVFKRELLSEKSQLEKAGPKSMVKLVSMNLPRLESVWSVCKSCNSVTALGKKFYWKFGKVNGYPKERILRGYGAYSVKVDIVSDSGFEWVKVCWVTEKTLLFDMAKLGLVDSSDSDESEPNGAADMEEDVPRILRQARALKKAADATRLKYRHPKLRMVFPRLNKVEASDTVCKLLQQIKDLEITVETLEDLPPSRPIAEALPVMAAQRHQYFGHSLNLDCTILLALISDLSHGSVEPQDWHCDMIVSQIKLEELHHLLPESIYPVMASRRLVCTREAATRMIEIAESLGTEAEKARTALIFDRQCTLDKEESSILERFQKLSNYVVPTTLCLPVEIIDFDLPELMEKLPPFVKEIFPRCFTAINQSVFLYGWHSGITTLSSNESVSRRVELVVEENRLDDNMGGPDIWVCPSSRSLVGKEKKRRGPVPVLSRPEIVGPKEMKKREKLAKSILLETGEDFDGVPELADGKFISEPSLLNKPSI